MSQTSAETSSSPVEQSPNVSIETLEDILYEMLATGVDPDQVRVTPKEIEQFLYEHARTAKSATEFLAFFEKHGLPLEPPEIDVQPAGLSALQEDAQKPPPRSQRWLGEPGGEPGGPPGQPGPAGRLGRVHRTSGHPPARPGTDSRQPVPVAAAVQPMYEMPHEQDRGRADSSFLVWGAISAIVVVLGLFAGAAYVLFDNMRTELQQARALQAQDRHRVEGLNDRVTRLQSNVVYNGDSLESLEPKIDRLVETLAPEPQARPGTDKR